MSTFTSLQRKNHFTSIPAAPTYDSLRPPRTLASRHTPVSEQAHHVMQTQLEHAARPGHSFGRVSLLPQNRPAPSSRSVRRQPVDDVHTIQRSPLSNASAREDQLGQRIRAARNEGHPLDASAQQSLESGLRANLSSVRVHTDSEADRLSRSVNAMAFTTGTDIFFRSGMYNPHSSQGLHLLAHEAVHVVQQATGAVAGIPRTGGISLSDPHDHFEQAAEASAARFIAGASLPGHATDRSGIHDQPLQAQLIQGGSSAIHHSMSEASGRQVIQRNVGYEFEDRSAKVIKPVNPTQYQHDLWKLGINPELIDDFKEKYRREKYYPVPKTPILEKPFFTLETDNTEGDANVEFVVHGPRPGKAGFGFRQRNEMVETIKEVQKLATQINTMEGKPFPAKLLDNKAVDGIFIDNPLVNKYLVQATAGIRLDKLTRLGKLPQDKPELGSDKTKALEDLKSELKTLESKLSQFSTRARNAIESDPKLTEARSNRLVNLLSLIALYIDGASRLHPRKDKSPAPEMIKNLTQLMARTNFVMLFDLLPPRSKNYLQKNQGIWVELVAKISGKDVTKPLFSNFPANYKSERFPNGLPLTISEWITGMLSGTDKLQQMDPSAALGAYERKTDLGNPIRQDAPKQQPIFEFRRLDDASPAQFLVRAEAFFDYIKELNKEK